MKINTKQTFKSLRGQDVSVADNAKSSKDLLTLGMVLAEAALTSPHQHKKGFHPTKAYDLAKRFYAYDVLELEDPDFSQLKELLEANQIYPSIIIAQALEMLEESPK